MLKATCVFDREILEAFFQKVGIKEEYADNVMYYGLFELGVLIGLIRMYPSAEGCIIEDVIWAGKYPIVYDEFLTKSAINFGLTFKTDRLIMTKKYKRFLDKMNFVEEGDRMVGKVDEIDFPHACGCG